MTRTWTSCLLGGAVALAGSFVDADELPAPLVTPYEDSAPGLSVTEASLVYPSVDPLAARFSDPPLAPPTKPKKPAAPAFPGPKVLPPTGPWKLMFFENDFSYKSDPDHKHLLGEELKDMKGELFGEQLNVSVGGEIRQRYMNEDNRLRPGGPLQADYNLLRIRQYLDVKLGDVRVYAEGIHADRLGSEGPDQPIDVNQAELLNLFVDWMVCEGIWGTHTLRYGRQELIFGRQRLVSPLDWANTRRNFEGFRYLFQGEHLKTDVFLVRPVNSATGFQPVDLYDSQFDQPNYNVFFAGLYNSYSGYENTILDWYWLYLENTEIEDPAKPDGERHLLGSRWSHLHPVFDATGKEHRVWDFDFEGGVQVGNDHNEDVLAGFATGIIGHTWKQALWSPRVSGLAYYGSGDRQPGTGHNNTFNTLFPLGHAYWALSDNLAGQNLIDYSIQGEVKPTKKTALVTAGHWFQLASNGDKLYNVAGNPVGTPRNGRDVGQSLDIYGYFALKPYMDV